MTETISAVTCSPISGDKNWPSVGRAALSYDIKIIDCDGKEVAPGKTGEICVHGIPGRSLTPGYYNDQVRQNVFWTKMDGFIPVTEDI